MDYGSAVSAQHAALQPGGTGTEKIGVPGRTPSLKETDTLVRLDVKVWVVIYGDQTADVADPEAFLRHVQERQLIAASSAKAAQAMGETLADASQSHPGADAAQRIRQYLYEEQAHGARTLNKGLLLLEANELEKSSQRATGANLSEREYIRLRMEQKTKDAAQMTAFADVRRAQ